MKVRVLKRVNTQDWSPAEPGRTFDTIKDAGAWIETEGDPRETYRINVDRGSLNILSPDCRVYKHDACNGDAWDPNLDNFTDCECDCHR